MRNAALGSSPPWLSACRLMAALVVGSWLPAKDLDSEAPRRILHQEGLDDGDVDLSW